MKSLKAELSQATQERDELQTRMEQEEEEDLLQWENLLREDKIEDPENPITTTRHNLAPSINIFQYQQA